MGDTARTLEQLARLALAGTPLPPALNVAGPEPVSLRRFATAIGEILGIAVRFETAAKARTMNLVADLKLLESLVRPKFTPFAEAMAASYGPGGLSPLTAATAPVYHFLLALPRMPWRQLAGLRIMPSSGIRRNFGVGQEARWVKLAHCDC